MAWAGGGMAAIGIAYQAGRMVGRMAATVANLFP